MLDAAHLEVSAASEGPAARERGSRSATARRSTRTTTSSTTATRARGRFSVGARICLFGHTHVPAIFATAQDPVVAAPRRRRTSCACPGRPGADQRRLGRPAARRRSPRRVRHRSIWSGGTLRLRRVAYDVAARAVPAILKRAGCRTWLAHPARARPDELQVPWFLTCRRSSLAVAALPRRSSARTRPCAARDPRIHPITMPISSTAGMKMKWLDGMATG